MNPIVLHLIACDNVWFDPNRPQCHHIDCLQTSIVPLDTPAYPLLKDSICIYVVLTELRGLGRVQVRVAFIDEVGAEVLLFGSKDRDLDYRGSSPLDVHAFAFRITNCTFPHAGDYTIQFCYNGVVVERRSIRLK